MKRNVTAVLCCFVAASLCGCESTDATKSTSGKGELVVTVSAEGLGANGYAFPPPAGQEVAFVDGWDVKFHRILVVVDRIRLAEMPDKNPGSQGETGKEIARRDGPFVVDALAHGTETDKGGAGDIAVKLPISDLKDIFDLEQRYAFSFDFVRATQGAQRINVEADDEDYKEMVEKGYRILFDGTASFKANDADCKASKEGYAFGDLPKKVHFRFGFEGDVAYQNCQNPDNTGEAFEGEESQRGIQMLPNGRTVAQITLHTDHMFWNTVSHENVPLFNQFAANAKKVGEDYVITLDDLERVPLSPVTDANKTALPWRTCVSEDLYELPSSPREMTFDPMGNGLTSLRAFVAHNARTLGHLNADGLCYVQEPEENTGE